jgi:hypothetical protein
MASGVTRQSLVSRSTTAGGSSPRSMVAGAGSTSRGRVANTAASGSTSYSTVAATVATQQRRDQLWELDGRLFGEQRPHAPSAPAGSD